MKVLFVIGTRPEAIKICPLIKVLRVTRSFEVRLCVTAQHRDMLDQILAFFQIVPEYDLDIMQKDQSLSDVTCNVLQELGPVLSEFLPDYVIVHGDTTTTMAASLAAYYQKVPVAHVEAGLRTKDIYSPWPEEINRQLTSRIAAIHFAPTERAMENLKSEGVDPRNIRVVGNTVIDALLYTSAKLDSDVESVKAITDRYRFLHEGRRIILVTGHRRENFGAGFVEICGALKALASRGDVQIVYPLHRNPKVRHTVEALIGEVENIEVIDPLDYMSFVYFMKMSHLILTDSGGIQEEAPSLGKPVLVMRDVTERPEALEAGTVKLVGSSKSDILEVTTRLLDDNTMYREMVRVHNPYGDGRSSERIRDYFLLRGKRTLLTTSN